MAAITDLVAVVERLVSSIRAVPSGHVLFEVFDEPLATRVNIVCVAFLLHRHIRQMHRALRDVFRSQLLSAESEEEPECAHIK